ncbi:hypothetical protein [Balneola sp. EhC07]|uniref:hypothetical protein n=1 Tax=Balneola sp. EhC07 TaxID=1849360 RepID=UPI001F3CE839|nr:hypothetical protein [Balneola sp. EhC07]
MIAPELLAAQIINSSHSNQNDILIIFQMNSNQIGSSTEIDLKSDKFKLHELTGGDSLLVEAKTDSIFYSIEPSFIEEIIVIKNSYDEINHYSSKNYNGVVIVKFKNKDQFLSIICNK